ADSLPGAAGDWARSALQNAPQRLKELNAQALTSEKGGAAVAAVGGALSAGARMFLKAFLMLIALYFLLVDGRRLRDWMIEAAPLCRLCVVRTLIWLAFSGIGGVVAVTGVCYFSLGAGESS